MPTAVASRLLRKQEIIFEANCRQGFTEAVTKCLRVPPDRSPGAAGVAGTALLVKRKGRNVFEPIGTDPACIFCEMLF